MTLHTLLTVLMRRWWLVALAPAIAFPLLMARARMQPFQTSFNAIVLLPGDTEIPGSSERPELMVMDDLPALVSSEVFAGAVATDLAARQPDLTGEAVYGSIEATRYSRVVTVTVARDSAEEALDMAISAAAVLPDQVNATLVGDGSASSTVRIIDPPGDPTRSRPNQTIVIIALTLLAAAAGAAIALLASAWPGERDGPVGASSSALFD